MKRDNRRYGDLSDPADNLLSFYDRWTDEYAVPGGQTFEGWLEEQRPDVAQQLDLRSLPDFVPSKDGPIPLRIAKRDHRREVDSRSPADRLLGIWEIWQNDESVPPNMNFETWIRTRRPDLVPLLDAASA